MKDATTTTERGSGRHSILFVDDEAMVLQGLQRMLRPMRGEWDVDFRESGAKALEAMEEKSYDILVSDMRMPGMDGAQLLSRTMTLHPSTLRFVLSGQADREMILQTVGATHQYLSKPCDADLLITTLRRGLDLKAFLGSEELRSLVSRMQTLPSAPALYQRIIERLQVPDTTMQQVAEVIAQDPAMTAQILKVVNSAFFGLPLRISGIAEALSYLGLEIIRSLVLSIHVFRQFEGADTGSLELDALWAHSFEVAAGAKAIVTLEGGSKTMEEEAFTAGLLHDAGKLILAVNFPEKYRRFLHPAHDGIPATEEGLFGSGHSEIGAYLFGVWGLPAPVVEAIAFHHCPTHGDAFHFSPLTAVHAADALVHERRHERGGLDGDYLSGLGLADRIEAWREAV